MKSTTSDGGSVISGVTMRIRQPWLWKTWIGRRIYCDWRPSQGIHSLCLQLLCLSRLKPYSTLLGFNWKHKFILVCLLPRAGDLNLCSLFATFFMNHWVVSNVRGPQQQAAPPPHQPPHVALLGSRPPRCLPLKEYPTQSTAGTTGIRFESLWKKKNQVSQQIREN